MAFDYPDLGTDQVDSWANGFKAKVKAILNAFPGSALVINSVTVDKLAKQKARFTVSWCAQDTPINASINPIFSRTFLNSDGAAAVYKIVGWSVSVNNIAAATALAKSVSTAAPHS